jgi:MoaA/NifB/PqqE/SkfB family radical SAM enzyme
MYGDLKVRLYGSELAVLSRYDGRRLGISGPAARVISELQAAVGLKEICSLLAAEEKPDGEAGEILAVIGALLQRLDGAQPLSYSRVLKQADGLWEHTMQHRLPLYCLFEITYRCNLSCEHCYLLHRVTGDQPEIDEATAIEVIDELDALGCIDITFTGGEPTLHRSLPTLLEHAKQRHFYTVLKTNGMTMTRRNAERYAESPAHETHLSIYGATAEVHDRMTTVPGSFEKSLQGIRELGRAGVSCAVQCLLWNDSGHQAHDMKRLVEDLGQEPVFVYLMHSRLDSDHRPLELKLGDEMLEQLIAEGFVEQFAPAPCTAGKGKLKVSPEGAVATCEFLPKEFGKVTEESLTSIWRSSDCRQYAQQIIDIAMADAPHYCCPGLNLINTGKLTGVTTA